MSSLRIRLWTCMRTTFGGAQKVGVDLFGNTYYQQPRKGARPRRWVVFKGLAEGSKIPPQWHGWMHHIFDTLPQDQYGAPYDWQKIHQPNLSGTTLAYVPHGDRDATPLTSYEPWKPTS